MSWFTNWSALLLVVGFTLPLMAQDAKKPDDKKDAEKKAEDKKGDVSKPDDTKKEEKEKLLPAGSLAGKITNLNEEKKTLKVEVAFTITKLNEGEAQGYMAAQAAYQRAATNPQMKPQDRAREMASQLQAMQMHSAKMYNYEKKTKEIDLQLLDDVMIRVANPPIAFDDEGKKKTYTKKELDELKGDPKLPGYPAEFSTLGTGQYVQVAIVRKKPTKPMTPPERVVPEKGVGGLPKPKNMPNADVLAEHFPLVSMIVVVGQKDK